MYAIIFFELDKKGQKIESTQIKAFECMLDTYHVGDMIPSAPMFVLIEEWNYCSNYNATIEFYLIKKMSYK